MGQNGSERKIPTSKNVAVLWNTEEYCPKSCVRYFFFTVFDQVNKNHNTNNLTVAYWYGMLTEITNYEPSGVFVAFVS